MHAVFDALVDLGHDEIAVVQLENRSEAEVRALRLPSTGSPRKLSGTTQLAAEFEYLISVGF